VSLTGVARALPAGVRARVFALMSLGWVVPGLLGPPLGGTLASTVGWRWVFLAPLPLVVLSRLLVLPPLRRLHVGGGEPDRLSPGTALGFGGGGAALAIGLSAGGLGGGVLAATGAVALGVALTRLVRRRDSPLRGAVMAVVTGNLLLNCAYFAGDGFVPLAITARGGTLVEASLALTVSSLTWAAASWYQSRVSTAVSPRALVMTGWRPGRRAEGGASPGAGPGPLLRGRRRRRVGRHRRRAPLPAQPSAGPAVSGASARCRRRGRSYSTRPSQPQRGTVRVAGTRDPRGE
jgi:MFS family permease